MNTFKKRIFGLDVVRATAILLILFSHSTLLLFPKSESFIIKIIQFFGTIGVDIFFVLSGYLIGTILIKHIEENRFTSKHILYFWLRRWFRTLPNYFLILLINIGLFFVLNGAISERSWSYFLFLQNFHQIQPDFFTESWSLSIEEFAYIIGPLLLLIFGYIFNRINKYTFISITLVVILIGVFNRYHFHDSNINSIIVDSSWSKSLRKVVIYRIDSIYYGFLGAYFAYYYARHWNRLKKIFAISGFLIFFSIHIYILIQKIEPSVNSFFFNNIYLSILALSILLFFPLFSTWENRKIFKTIITKISIWSYAIYLVNYSIVLLTILHFIEVDKLNLILKLFVLIAFWMITFVLSYFLYSRFEKPMMDFRDSKSITNLFKTK